MGYASVWQRRLPPRRRQRVLVLSKLIVKVLCHRPPLTNTLVLQHLIKQVVTGWLYWVDLDTPTGTSAAGLPSQLHAAKPPYF